MKSFRILGKYFLPPIGASLAALGLAFGRNQCTDVLPCPSTGCICYVPVWWLIILGVPVFLLGVWCWTKPSERATRLVWKGLAMIPALLLVIFFAPVVPVSRNTPAYGQVNVYYSIMELFSGFGGYYLHGYQTEACFASTCFTNEGVLLFLIIPASALVSLSITELFAYRPSRSQPLKAIVIPFLFALFLSDFLFLSYGGIYRDIAGIIVILFVAIVVYDGLLVFPRAVRWFVRRWSQEHLPSRENG